MRASLVGAAFLIATVCCADRTVSFDEIKGARMVEGGVWRLALAGPEVGDVITQQSDISLPEGGEARLVDVPDTFSGREFTILIRFADVSGGPVRLSSPQAPEDVRSIMASRDGWRAIRFGPLTWQGKLPITIGTARPLRITAFTVCRTFRQMFGQSGQVTLEGAVYQEFGADGLLSPPLLPGSYRHHRTRQWNPPPDGEEDGVTGAPLPDHYQPLLVGPLESEFGVPTPVRAPDGVILCARIKSRFAFIVYPEVEKYQLNRTGEADKWSIAAVRLDGALLDGDGNGVYTGYLKHDWLTGKTWVDNFGTGFLDFVALLPQNEIVLDADGAKAVAFEFESDAGPQRLDVSLPKGAEALALVNAGPGRTRVLARVGDEYRALSVIDDSRSTNCLRVKAGSIQLRN